jgi:hypothetical protein
MELTSYDSILHWGNWQLRSNAVRHKGKIVMHTGDS